MNPEYIKNKVETALANYAQQTDIFNSGWDIIRYAGQGLIQIDAPTDIYLPFFTDAQAYQLLRFGKAGQLSYKPLPSSSADPMLGA